MQVVGCQIDTVWENKPATYARITSLLEATPPPHGALVVLPEMFSTGFSLNLAKTAEGDDRLSEHFLAAMATRLKTYVLGGIVRLGANGLGRNEAVLFDMQGQESARYCKLHPFSFGQENLHFEPGDQTIIFTCHDFKIAPFICYDLRFPEIFRQTVTQGVQMFVIIANWPTVRIDHWITLLKARAIENQAYVVAVNRCGADPNMTYSGRSMIIDPQGQTLADAGSEEAVISAELEVAVVKENRRIFPALADMRTPSQCDHT